MSEQLVWSSNYLYKGASNCEFTFKQFRIEIGIRSTVRNCKSLQASDEPFSMNSTLLDTNFSGQLVIFSYCMAVTATGKWGSVWHQNMRTVGSSAFEVMQCQYFAMLVNSKIIHKQLKTLTTTTTRMGTLLVPIQWCTAPVCDMPQFLCCAYVCTVFQNAPCSAPALAEAHPTLLCICLVIEKHCNWPLCHYRMVQSHGSHITVHLWLNMLYS